MIYASITLTQLSQMIIVHRTFISLYLNDASYILIDKVVIITS